MQLENPSANNRISIFGNIIGGPFYSHDVYGEAFYNFSLRTQRLSQSYDLLPITISERIIDVKEFVEKRDVYILGQIRSYNNYIEEENRNKLVLTIFAKDCQIIDEVYTKNPNEVFLDGFVCKAPVYRTTPFGREIADILVAVNRSYNKSDYIPCITWGRNARFSEKLNVGDNIKLWGRMQSRSYQKKLAEGDVIEKIAYEVSVSKIERSI